MNNKKYLRNLIVISIGALGGYLYYNFIGCAGSCVITGNPFVSTLYGAAIGLIFTDFKSLKKKVGKNEN